MFGRSSNEGLFLFFLVLIFLFTYGFQRCSHLRTGAKFGLRALAQSMARELGPKGIHVAHLIVDGPIDTQWTRGQVKDSASILERQGMVNPQDIAKLYWYTYQQPKTAWTHELDLRPWIETW